mmetsp:Transcript_52422/g.126888  ORF Transcript_52422/g.126888 Transcript_52422/m.126888 type:complete len:209 (+) Transcript_52422:3247-3873(+)
MVLLHHLDEVWLLHKPAMVNKRDHQCPHRGSHRCQCRVRVLLRPNHRWVSVGHLSKLHTVEVCHSHLPRLWELRNILHNTEVRQVGALPRHLSSRRDRLHQLIATHRVAVHLLDQPKEPLHLLLVEVDILHLRRWEVWPHRLLDVHHRATGQTIVHRHRHLVPQEDARHRLLQGLRVDALLLLRHHPGELVKGPSESKIIVVSINYCV